MHTISNVLFSLAFILLSCSYEKSLSAEPDLSILDCPPEDVAEYPVSEPEPVRPPDEQLIDYFPPLKLSTAELSFGKQGGVRCIATSGSIYTIWEIWEESCRSENTVVSGNKKFKKLICPWFTATKIDDCTLHISVKRNETGNERKEVVRVSSLYNIADFTITQSAE
jgi:hypothetical protein